MSGNLTRIGHVGETVPLGRGTRELEWFAGFLADRAENCQRHTQVHSIADGIANHRVRAVHAPRKAIQF
ncbi:hypothetical protein D3C76_1494680 [compost metagenome]